MYYLWMAKKESLRENFVLIIVSDFSNKLLTDCVRNALENL